jgi:phospholipid-transporting ATPase
MINAISESDGYPTMYIPLSFILLLTMIKDIFEDLKRHKSD